MRMRKKKYLDERLDVCEEYLIPTACENRDFSKADENEMLIDIREIFGNDNPLCLEIGCGKGQFVTEMAKRNPHINYIAVEKVRNVIVAACEKAKQENLENVRFMACSAEYLPSYISKDSVQTIFLNFSCPFPKAKYARHRLTHRYFLEIYRKLLKNGGEIHQKTDNMHFFEFSVEEYTAAGYKIKNLSLDLHNSGFEGNIVTEYEKRFSDLGQPIYRLEAF